MFAFYSIERDEDPDMLPKPISPEKREEVIVHMAAGLLGAYRYFRAHRRLSPDARFSEPPDQRLSTADSSKHPSFLFRSRRARRSSSFAPGCVRVFPSNARLRRSYQNCIRILQKR
jgi:hypothetical protein